jgi:hypothetical protein
MPIAPVRARNDPREGPGRIRVDRCMSVSVGVAHFRMISSAGFPITDEMTLNDGPLPMSNEIGEGTRRNRYATPLEHHGFQRGTR